MKIKTNRSIKKSKQQKKNAKHNVCEFIFPRTSFFLLLFFILKTATTWKLNERLSFATAFSFITKQNKKPKIAWISHGQVATSKQREKLSELLFFSFLNLILDLDKFKKTIEQVIGSLGFLSDLISTYSVLDISIFKVNNFEFV